MPTRMPFCALLAGLCGAAALGDAGYLLAGAPALAADLPLGALPGGAVLALDGLSAFFLLPVLVAGTAAFAASAAAGKQAALLAAFLAGMVLCLAAADGLTLVAGFELMSGASLALVLTGDATAASRQAAILYGGMAAFSAFCLLGVVGLLGGDGLSFVAMRAHPPHGAVAAAAFGLVLLGAGAKAGLAPLHVWLPPAHAAAPTPVSALMSGAMTKVALYVMARVLLDLCGPAQPAAWGALLMLVGAASAVLGTTRANVETDLKTILGCSTIENVGIIAVGLGVALAARAADLPGLAALALAAALLHVLAHALFKSLLFLAAGEVNHEAGSRQLDRLGGLIHGMRITTACVMVGAASLAALPVSAGFAGGWMVLQAVLAAPRVGGLAFQMVACVVAASLALAAALAAAAAVRLVGVGFLGRPRTPRGAAAEDPPRPMRRLLLALAALTAALGVLPQVGLALAAPAVRLLLGERPAADWLAVHAQAEGSTYVPLGLILLLAMSMLGLIWLARWRAVPGWRRAPSWDGGFGPPPLWLPFGDPGTQATAAGLSHILRSTVGSVLLQARQTATATEIVLSAIDPAEAVLFTPLGRVRGALSGWAERLQVLTARQALVVVFAVLVLLLAIVAGAEQM